MEFSSVNDDTDVAVVVVVVVVEDVINVDMIYIYIPLLYLITKCLILRLKLLYFIRK